MTPGFLLAAALAAAVLVAVSTTTPAAAAPQPLATAPDDWGGSRTADPASFRKRFKAGYAVLSSDQRGFGESGGHANVEDPDVEGHDTLVGMSSRTPGAVLLEDTVVHLPRTGC